MPDAMERVQQLASDHAEDALKRHADRPQHEGRRVCANLDCGEPISEQRQALGAQLCIDCQRADEAHAAHFRQWSVR